LRWNCWNLDTLYINNEKFFLNINLSSFRNA
jgi:hypothetical protein